MIILRHTHQHHRITHHRWTTRRRRLLSRLWPWWHVRPQDVDTHTPPHLLGKKRKTDRRIEERRFRQQVRQAMTHDEPMPRYRHDWAD